MSIGSFLKKAVKSVGSTVSSAVRPIEKAVSSIKKVPVLGQAFDVVVSKVFVPTYYLEAGKIAVKAVKGKPIGKAITTGVKNVALSGTQAKNLVDAGHAIVQGQRLDRAALDLLGKETKDFRATAPYAASVVSLVPGVGTGTAAAIMAGATLAEGRPLDEVALAAVKAAVPGGPVAQAAFSVAEGIVTKKSVDEIAINAMPIGAKEKQALRAIVALAKDLAEGKRVDIALAKRIDDGIKILSPQLQKAVTIGLSTGIAKEAQMKIAAQISSPQAQNVLATVGKGIAAADKIANAARDINKSPLYQKGFDIGTGIMNANANKVTQTMLESARKSLSGEVLKGFDAALALQIGRKEMRVKKIGRVITNHKPVKAIRKASLAKPVKAIKKASPAQTASYLMTHGLVGAAEGQKVGIIKELAKSPETREGAVDAIKDIAVERKKESESLWQLIKRIFFGAK